MRDIQPSTFWPLSKLQVATPLAMEDLWRSLYFFGLYRLMLGGLLLLLSVAFGQAISLNAIEQAWVYRLCIVYIFLTLFALVGVQLRHPAFPLQLAFQVGTDIAVISTMSYFSGGIKVILECYCSYLWPPPG